MPDPSAGERALRGLKTLVLKPIRRGKRTVSFPNENARLGNLMYDWLHAAIAQGAGADYRVLETPASRPWRDEFPKIFDEIVVARSDVHIWDRRETNYWQSIGDHFSLAELNSFCRRYIAEEPVVHGERPAVPHYVSDPGTVVVNVRRGDYYSDPTLRGNYGFDVARYVKQALQEQEGRRPVVRVHVVSDDLVWCAKNLTEAISRHGEISLAPSSRTPVDDFACLVRAERLILTNSTFSYWAGYVAQELKPSPIVVAPIFHARQYNNGHSFHLHPDWICLTGYGELPDPVRPRRV